MNANEWQIRPAAGACAPCGRAFENGESFLSRLVFDAEGVYRRDDFCEGCWTGDRKAEPCLSVWRTAYRAPAPPPPEAVGRETAESLLRKFMEEENPEHRDAVFVLAVMLERRRILVERDVQHTDDGPLLRIYEHRGTGETFMVVDPRLRLDALEQVQTQVVTLLGGPDPDRKRASRESAPPAPAG